jgi:hypothetical protein
LNFKFGSSQHVMSCCKNVCAESNKKSFCLPGLSHFVKTSERRAGQVGD